MPSGGSRPGAGRKRSTISEQALKRLMKAFEAKAKEQGRDVFDLLAEIAFNNMAVITKSWNSADQKKEKITLEVPVRDRLAAIGLYMTYTISKHSEKEVETRQIGPTIKLPPIKKKPDDEIIYPAMVN